MGLGLGLLKMRLGLLKMRLGLRRCGWAAEDAAGAAEDAAEVAVGGTLPAAGSAADGVSGASGDSESRAFASAPAALRVPARAIADTATTRLTAQASHMVMCVPTASSR